MMVKIVQIKNLAHYSNMLKVIIMKLGMQLIDKGHNYESYIF
jgi:hypothetical protein